MIPNVLATVLTGVLLAGLLTPSYAQQTPPAAARATTAIDINSATVADLEGLPGIGRRTAERIVEHRQKHSRGWACALITTASIWSPQRTGTTASMF